MKKVFMLLVGIMVLGVACKKKDSFLEADVVLKKWVIAIKHLNYKQYKECEAYPKLEPVFKEMYNEYYLGDLMVTSIEDFDKNKKKTDPDGHSFYHRKVEFECTEIRRKTNKPVKVIRGNVIFIRFIEGGRKDDGWLLSNRTLTRISR